jgi:hypothetical protein
MGVLAIFMILIVPFCTPQTFLNYFPSHIPTELLVM